MNQDFKLPPRRYYTLDQAAKELNCDRNYLLHLGATSRLILVYPKTSDFELGHTHNDFAGLFAQFIELSSYDCWEIEFNGQTTSSIFNHIYEQDEFGCYSRISAQECVPEDVELKPLETSNFFSISNKDRSQKIPITIHIEKILLLDDEVVRIKKELALSQEIADSLNRGKAGKPEANPIRTQKENNYLRTIAALAMLYTKSNCEEPHHASTTIAIGLGTHSSKYNLSEVPTDKTIAEYIKKGKGLLTLKKGD